MADFFVDSTRPDDSGNGTSEGTAKQTLQAGLDLLTNGDILNIKASGTYSISTSLTLPSGNTYTALTRVRGYTTTPGDGGKAHIQATAAITMLAPGANGASWEDLDLDGDSTATTGASFAGYSGNSLFRCRVRNCGTGVTLAASNHVSDCEITGCTTVGATAAAAECHLVDCWIHDNTCPGVIWAPGGSITHCRVTNNTGGTSDGIRIDVGYGVLIKHCTLHGNGRDGLRFAANYPGLQPGVQNCLFTENGGYGITFSSAPWAAQVPAFRTNAFRNNTSGPYSHSMTGFGDVTLTADPYTNAAGDDFSLNDTAGGGAAARGAGYPANLDIGAVQHADPVGGGGNTYSRGRVVNAGGV